MIDFEKWIDNLKPSVKASKRKPDRGLSERSRILNDVFKISYASYVTPDLMIRKDLDNLDILI